MKKLNLEQLLKNLKLNYVNSDITATNFPDDQSSGKVKIIHLNEYLSTEEVIKKLSERDYRPATLREMLIWANKEWNGKDFIVALGSVWLFRRGDRRVPYLLRDGSERRLYLSWVGFRWDGYCRFAAVRKFGSRKTENLETSGRLDSLETRLKSLEDDMGKIKKFLVF